MKKSYTSNYLKIYFWQSISLVAGFLTFLIVVPRLTSIPSIYGIFSICMATTLFFTYADLGFIGAGYKYASEKFAISDLKEETRIVGFISFILFISVLLFSAVILVFAFNPQMLIRGLSDPREITIASKLLFILALFSPIVILQRLCQVVFGIRLEDYIYQRYSIMANLVRIASVFYFFQGSKYNIVGYFLFFQLVGLLFNSLYLLIIKSRYHYDFWLLARSFRFSKEIYDQTKKLALGSFLTMLIFILYYELDLFVIGNLSGAEMAGFYSIGLTILGFFRGIIGMLYGPFMARFNHFIGLNDLASLKKILYRVIILTLPLIVFSILSIVMLMKPLIFCWVGAHYYLSISVAQFLLLGFIYNFFAQPAAILVMTQARVKIMYAITLIAVFVYWVGIFLTFSHLGILAFAVFKFVVFTISGILYFMILAKFLEYNPLGLLKKIISPAVVPVLFLVIILGYINRFMPLEKNKADLLLVIGAGALASFVALCLYYIFSGYFQDYFKEKFVKLTKFG